MFQMFAIRHQTHHGETDLWELSRECVSCLNCPVIGKVHTAFPSLPLGLLGYQTSQGGNCSQYWDCQKLMGLQECIRILLEL